MSSNIPTNHTISYHDHTVAYTTYDLPSTHSTPKTTLVFIHGWTCASSLWLPGSLPLFQNPTYRSIVIDLPGHGASTAVEGTDYSIEFFAHAIGTVLAQANVTSNAVLVGHSLGGTIATFVLKFYPSTVAGLVYVDSFFALPEHYLTNEERIARRESVRNSEKFISGFSEFLYGARTTPALRQQIDETVLATPQHVRISVVGTNSLPPVWKPENVYSDVAALSIKAEDWSNIDAHPGWNRVLPRIEEEDWNANTSQTGENPRWSHFLFMEDPERFVKSVEAFLERNGFAKSTRVEQ